MWELVHMPDVSLESDVARVRDPPRPFWRGTSVGSASGCGTPKNEEAECEEAVPVLPLICVGSDWRVV